MTPFWRMAYTIAAAVGCPYPQQMMAAMPYRTWRGWIAFNEIDPIGEKRADYRAAITDSLIANGLLRRKNQRAYEIEDFVPQYGPQEPSEAVSNDEIARKLKGLTRAMGGRIIYRDKEGNVLREETA